MQFRNSSGALQKEFKELESSGSSRSEYSCFVFLLTGQEFSLIIAAEIRAFWFLDRKGQNYWSMVCAGRRLVLQDC